MFDIHFLLSGTYFLFVENTQNTTFSQSLLFFQIAQIRN